MSMMTFFRRAFGSSSVTEDEEVVQAPAEDPGQDVGEPTVATSEAVDQSVPPPYTSGSGTAVPESDASPAVTADADGDPTLADDLFDAVIELFNRSQPEFVRQCLNVEAQRSYIINSLSSSLRRRMTALSSGDMAWMKERDELESRLASLEGEGGEIERLRTENESLRSGSENQQRELNERIQELERHVRQLTQEKEGYLNHSNAFDNSHELSDAHDRIQEMEAEMEATRAKLSEAEERNLTFEIRIDELESRLAAGGDVPAAEPAEKADAAGAGARIVELEGQKTSLENEKAELTAECERLRAEIERQSTLREQLEVKASMSDAMINELRNNLASARAEIEQINTEQETAISQIQQQLEGFEDLKARKNAKIKELKEANANLHKTIETNLYNQANSEMKLRLEIKGLKAEIEKLSAATEGAPVIVPVPEETMTQPQARPSRRRGRPKKARIDSDLDNTEWFAAGKESKRPDPDFGYHEPPRRPMNDDEAQLTLF